MEAWIIKPKTDNKVYFGEYGFTTRIYNAKFYQSKDAAMVVIDVWALTDCHPVKVQIEEIL